MKFYDSFPINTNYKCPSNDSWMNSRNILQTMVMESNNDLKFVESLAAAMTYLTK